MVRSEQERQALLVGVPRYDVNAIPDLPVVNNDVQILHDALESSRFTIREVGVDGACAPTRSTIIREIRHFCSAARKGSTQVLYFSGHGVHYKNKDYLVPSDATLDDPANVAQYLVPVDLGELFDECSAQTILFFIDACRSGLKLVDVSKGLSLERWSDGELQAVTQREFAIVFSCAAGQESRFVEEDQGNRYSFFTRALADVIHSGHPATRFGEVSQSLQERLDELTSLHNRPTQTAKLRAEFDLRQQLWEREVCDTSRKEEPQSFGGRTEGDIQLQKISVKSFLGEPGAHSKKAVYASVLVADLVGSTEFKLDHSEIEAIEKVVLHNNIVTDVIEQNHGTVVKHVADRVMGVFEEKECEARAISAGVAIISRIAEENKSRKLGYPKDLNTSIGVESGPLWTFSYENGIDDCQGRIVDVAFRLANLAGPQQLVCAEGTFQRVQLRDEEWVFSDVVERLVKGKDDPLPVRLIVPNGYPHEAQLIPLCGFSRPVSEAVKAKLKMAGQRCREKRPSEALDLYREVLQVDGANFEANICCAQIRLDLLRQEDGNRTRVLDTIIHKHLCVAKQIRPESNRVWILFGRAYLAMAVEKNDSSFLDTAQKRAELALNCAQEQMDLNGQVQARILLADILRVRAKGDEGDRAEHLARANEHCSEVADQGVGALERSRSDYLVIQGMLQRELGAEMKVVEEMFEKAKVADPKNPRVHEALAELYRTQGHGIH